MNALEARIRCLEMAERIALREGRPAPAHLVALAEPLLAFALGPSAQPTAHAAPHPQSRPQKFSG
ncbi:MAG: hypothetical protein AB7G15_17120 [Alphaproteobacteria bacterium]